MCVAIKWFCVALDIDWLLSHNEKSCALQLSDLSFSLICVDNNCESGIASKVSCVLQLSDFVLH